jgi:uncharacterized protein (UPF0305 family)
MLESQREELSKEYQQYQAITGEINSMTSAYYKYLQAKKTPNGGEEYGQFTGASKELKAGHLYYCLVYYL